MHRIKILLITSVVIFGWMGCNQQPNSPKKAQITKKEPSKSVLVKKEKEKSEARFQLTDKNAIPFFNQYAKDNPENNVRIITSYGNIDIELYKNTPYHRANFVYLTKQKYFDGTFFHRIVKDFIIQGGNSDRKSTSQKRRRIGKYLLPPDTQKGNQHHRGVISMPSSEIDNPHKLASPYEFFIIQKKDGAYHLDGNYTAFGKVTSGMHIVDKIAHLPADRREWPIDNVVIKTELIE
ncbi:MAG: peptidylprolyl isomerase [Flavobacteriaceae bacterium]|nr:peptidylprolyl isomerase [Flavobacteriaceae bacterium]MDG2315141.1 peptidylprolyl isomerase [Flavobacteriaceae bacterium]